MKVIVIKPLPVRAYNLGVGKRENQKHAKQREKSSVKELQSGRTGVKEKKIVSDLKAEAVMVPASPPLTTNPHPQPDGFQVAGRSPWSHTAYLPTELFN